MSTFKIIQEGVFAPFDRKVLPGALTWLDRVPIYLGSWDSPCAFTDTLRREGDWIVFDLDDYDPAQYDCGAQMYDLHWTKELETDEQGPQKLVLSAGTIQAIILAPIPAQPKLKADWRNKSEKPWKVRKWPAIETKTVDLFDDFDTENNDLSFTHEIKVVMKEITMAEEDMFAKALINMGWTPPKGSRWEK